MRLAKRVSTIPLQVGLSTDVGLVREQNEDYCGSYTSFLGDLFVVCDGMGGHNAGEVASRLAVESIGNFFETTHSASPDELLKGSIENANSIISQKASEQKELSGMGTTIAVLFIPRNDAGKAYYTHVGDSRIYLIRKKRITRLTSDHSRVMALVELGVITIEEAASHPQKNVITRALGLMPEVEVEIAVRTIKNGDRFLLCTDGVTDLLSDTAILSFAKSANAQIFADRLVKEANAFGGRDNSTVLVVDTIKQVKKETSIFKIFKLLKRYIARL